MMRLAAREWGRGPVRALLLHGFTRDGRMFDPFRSSWDRMVRAIAVDLPGHGWSAAPSGAQAFDGTVDALAAMLGHGPVVVIGYSMGGRLALALACRHPGLVRALVLDGASPGLEDAQERAARRHEDEGWARVLEEQGLAAFLAKWEALPLLAGAHDDDVRTMRREQSAPGLAAALRCLGLGAQPSYWSALERVHCPTLLLSGRSDLKFTALAERMAAKLPRANHVVVDGGHAAHLEAPHGWQHPIQQFLQSLADPVEVASARSP